MTCRDPRRGFADIAGVVVFDNAFEDADGDDADVGR